MKNVSCPLNYFNMIFKWWNGHKDWRTQHWHWLILDFNLKYGKTFQDIKTLSTIVYIRLMNRNIYSK